MIINVCMGTNDLARGAAFYDALAAELGLVRYMETDKAIGWLNPAAGIGLAITMPFDGQPANVGNGTMASIAATSEGAPGVRGNGYYCAYFRDPDGNKLNCVAMAR
jgi:catechol 2,3-dioxygenase-like lactoylglutathione lyase family enzyme